MVLPWLDRQHYLIFPRLLGVPKQIDIEIPYNFWFYAGAAAGCLLNNAGGFPGYIIG
jgi:hypothetical protein